MSCYNKQIATSLFLVAVFGSLFSQTPTILDAGFDTYFKFLWVFPFGFLMLTSPTGLLSNKLVPFYLFLLLFLYYCFTCQMLTNRQYFTNDLYNIAICLLITITSYIFWSRHKNPQTIKNLCIIMLICGSIMAIDLYINYLRNSDITSATYAYGDKNSIGQILLCCSCFALFYYKPHSKTEKMLSLSVSIILLIVMIMTRSRATLVSALYIGYYISFKKVKTKYKLYTLSLLGVIMIILLSNESLYDSIVKGILFGGRDATDINSLSSNRIILFSIALKLIPQHPWIGSGAYYVDCMPLNVLTQYGIIGLIVVLLFLLYIYISLRKHQHNRKISLVTYVFFMSFIINSLFEAYPPFGPGVKCFTLWMLYGMFLAELESIPTIKKTI